MVLADFRFLNRAPRSPALVPHVAQLFWARGRVPYLREAILPTGRPTLLVGLSDAFRLQAERETRVLRTSWVVGPQAAYLVNEPFGETHVVGVRFHPAGLAAFLDDDVAALHGRAVDLDDVWPAGAATRTRDRIGAARTPEARLDELEAALLEAYRPTDARARRVCRALDALSADLSRPVSAVCAELGVTHGYLIDEVRRHVGLTPKQFVRLARFRVALAAGARGPVRWSAVAHHAGYADQSHFNRDFRRFSGLSPTRYAAQRRAVLGDDGADAPEFVPLPESEIRPIAGVAASPEWPA